jgi:APA family basic amino acid/polyamine antiporter/L-type amino acid transporter 9
LLFVLATIFILVNAIADPTSRWPTLAVLGIILVGVPVYYLTVGKRVGGHRAEATGQP